MLVNRENSLSKSYIPTDLVDAGSSYKEKILINKQALEKFNMMKNDASLLGYKIDIMSGYRDYFYQEKIYNRLLKEKGLSYTLRSVAKAGCSEHQTGLAIDICVYRDNKCYIEHELEDTEEVNWVMNNAYKYGFILRYPKDMEDKTGYNYEPWHYRYVGDIAEYLYRHRILLDEFKRDNGFVGQMSH